MAYPPLRLSGRNPTVMKYTDTLVPAAFPSPSLILPASYYSGLANMAAFNRPLTSVNQYSFGGTGFANQGGVLAPNGYIYGAPNGTTALIKDQSLRRHKRHDRPDHSGELLVCRRRAGW